MIENPFTDETLAARYEEWYSGSGARADRQEKRLLQKMLAEFPGARSVLDVGCGTGHFTRWFQELGYEVTGLDSSPAMLSEAVRRGGATYVEGDALRLPFPDRAFDIVSLVTTLEFTGDPAGALAEAGRVARRGLLLGVLNGHSVLTWRYRRSGKPLWRAARFFTPGELARLVRTVLSDRVRHVHWRTTLWPWECLCDSALPWGGFIGLSARFD